jgi:hypothetical protein
MDVAWFESEVMSLADYASRPFPVLARVLSFLRNIAAFNVAFVRALGLFRAQGKAAGEFPARKFETLAPAVISHSSDLAAVVGESNPRAERERLIRRRWVETGIRMWKASLHAEGRAPLNIQGSVELLPLAPGETARRYDSLEFRLIDGRIVCEGVAVDPPLGPRKSPA